MGKPLADSAMHDVAIVGGGLCGLALATQLERRGLDWVLLEARDRLGGRILTDRSTGVAVDLGATWFWPQTHASMARLVADLRLPAVEQPDDGRLLVLQDTTSPARLRVLDAATGRLAEDPAHPALEGAVHGRAQRLVGGLDTLVVALEARLPAERLVRGAAVRSARRERASQGRGEGQAVALTVRHRTDEADHLVRARCVVFALPPRLVTGIGFDPPLPDALVAAQQATPTWMAAAAKAAVRCDRRVWRERGQAGNAWVTHEQGVWAESWDASSPALDGSRQGEPVPMLAGFLAPPPSARAGLRESWPLLLETQVQMLHGPDAGAGDSVVQDWVDEPWTCSALDRFEDGRAHAPQGDPLLREPAWDGSLWWAGSETSSRHPGYLEGALVAAARVSRQLAEAGIPGARAPAPRSELT
jgi:monoamine oxidase